MNEQMVLLAVAFFVAVAAIAYWRIVLMLTAAALLSVIAVGIIDIASWIGSLS